MRTIYLRYRDRNDARDALAATLGWEPDTTTGELSGTRYDVDEVGVLYAPTPEDAAEDYRPEARDGWHVNVLWWGETAPDFGDADLTPDPETPSRIFNIEGIL